MTAATSTGRRHARVFRHSASPITRITASSTPITSERRATSRAAAASICAPGARCSHRSVLSSFAGNRDGCAARRAPCRERTGRWPSFCAATPGRMGQIRGLPREPLSCAGQKYLRGSACSLMSVGIKGGYAAAVKFHDALKLVTRLVNLGDAKSLACHPASTTHRQMSAEEQRKRGRIAGDDSSQHRNRAHRRHSGRSGPGLAAALLEKRRRTKATQERREANGRQH